MGRGSVVADPVLGATMPCSTPTIDTIDLLARTGERRPSAGDDYSRRRARRGGCVLGSHCADVKG